MKKILLYIIITALPILLLSTCINANFMDLSPDYLNGVWINDSNPDNELSFDNGNYENIYYSALGNIAAGSKKGLYTVDKEYLYLTRTHVFDASTDLWNVSPTVPSSVIYDYVITGWELKITPDGSPDTYSEYYTFQRE
jgi:hypothetical protein